MSLTSRSPVARECGEASRRFCSRNPRDSNPILRAQVFLRVHVAVAVAVKARLHPHWIGGRDGYRYSVVHGGKLLVERRRDPEFDAARALLEQGLTGKLSLLDGKTGRPRITIDIEKGAKLRSDDTQRMRFRRWVPFLSGHVEGSSPEEASPVPDSPDSRKPSNGRDRTGGLQ